MGRMLLTTPHLMHRMQRTPNEVMCSWSTQSLSKLNYDSLVYCLLDIHFIFHVNIVHTIGSRRAFVAEVL